MKVKVMADLFTERLVSGAFDTASVELIRNDWFGECVEQH